MPTTTRNRTKKASNPKANTDSAIFKTLEDSKHTVVYGKPTTAKKDFLASLFVQKIHSVPQEAKEKKDEYKPCKVILIDTSNDDIAFRACAALGGHMNNITYIDTSNTQNPPFIDPIRAEGLCSFKDTHIDLIFHSLNNFFDSKVLHKDFKQKFKEIYHAMHDFDLGKNQLNINFFTVLSALFHDSTKETIIRHTKAKIERGIVTVKTTKVNKIGKPTENEIALHLKNEEFPSFVQDDDYIKLNSTEVELWQPSQAILNAIGESLRKILFSVDENTKSSAKVIFDQLSKSVLPAYLCQYRHGTSDYEMKDTVILKLNRNDNELEDLFILSMFLSYLKNRNQPYHIIFNDDRGYIDYVTEFFTPRHEFYLPYNTFTYSDSNNKSTQTSFARIADKNIFFPLYESRKKPLAKAYSLPKIRTLKIPSQTFCIQDPKAKDVIEMYPIPKNNIKAKKAKILTKAYPVQIPSLKKHTTSSDLRTEFCYHVPYKEFLNPPSLKPLLT